MIDVTGRGAADALDEGNLGLPAGGGDKVAVVQPAVLNVPEWGGLQL